MIIQIREKWKNESVKVVQSYAFLIIAYFAGQYQSGNCCFPLLILRYSYPEDLIFKRAIPDISVVLR